jgi:hypothetical protein
MAVQVILFSYTALYKHSLSLAYGSTEVLFQYIKMESNILLWYIAVQAVHSSALPDSRPGGGFTWTKVS